MIKVNLFAIDKNRYEQAIFKIVDNEKNDEYYVFAPLPWLWIEKEKEVTINHPSEEDKYLWTGFACMMPDFNRFGEPRPNITFDEFYKLLNENMTEDEMNSFGAYKNNPNKGCNYRSRRYSKEDEIYFFDENKKGYLYMYKDIVDWSITDRKTEQWIETTFEETVDYLKKNFKLTGRQGDIIEKVIKKMAETIKK